MQTFFLGTKSKTPASLAYIDGVINPSLLCEIQNRLSSIDTDYVLSSFDIEKMMEEKKLYTYESYDVAVIGAGHAGCEAALAAARLGMKTLLFSISLECIANMPCNPHIGGTSKGHLVREIDALGGEMGYCADKTHLQIKMLNVKKGPGVRSLRAQGCKVNYPKEMLNTLKNQGIC